MGTPVAAGVPGATGQNLKYDAPGPIRPVPRNIDIEDLGYDPRITRYPPGITPPLPTPTAVSSPHSTNDTEIVSPVLQSNASSNVMKRRSLGGSFLDVDVYQKALGCEVPWIDPCVSGDCFEGGTVYNSDMTPADGNADQSGPNGESTGEPISSSPPGGGHDPGSGDQSHLYWIEIALSWEAETDIYHDVRWQLFQGRVLDNRCNFDDYESFEDHHFDAGGDDNHVLEHYPAVATGDTGTIKLHYNTVDGKRIECDYIGRDSTYPGVLICPGFKDAISCVKVKFLATWTCPAQKPPSESHIREITFGAPWGVRCEWMGTIGKPLEGSGPPREEECGSNDDCKNSSNFEFCEEKFMTCTSDKVCKCLPT